MPTACLALAVRRPWSRAPAVSTRCPLSLLRDRIEGPDRAGLTAAAALLRPPFALERLEQASDDELIYRFRPPPHCTPPSARRRATHRRELTQARFAGRPATLSPPAPATPTACVELRGGV
jgi:hypothetical protein